ncbi:MAG: Rne/Rng family ribonuclease [Acidipropionibacterium jensenii]|nr:Rne/Rng family ribonuclease [Acidipropionibacterium jensenii]MDN5977145.1 Rne/Rng family ribonuclease [Acidipropionibacterium jensenii]
MVQDSNDSTTSESTPEKSRSRHHRAASRPAGAPTTPAITASPAAPALTIGAAGSGGSVITSATDTSDLPRPPVGRRRRATRSSSSPAAEKAAPRTAEKPVATAAEKAVEKTDEKPARTTRRRATRSQAPGTDEGAIDAALSKAAEHAADRTDALDAAVANPFASADPNRSTADILDSLAAESGGEEAAPKRTRRRRTRSGEKTPEQKDGAQKDGAQRDNEPNDNEQKPAEQHEEAAEQDGPTGQAPADRAGESSAPDQHEDQHDEDHEDQHGESEDADESRGTRRRRRRGGRRRRRGEAAEDHEDQHGEDSEESDGEDQHDKHENHRHEDREKQDHDRNGEEEAGSSRRRRRRRRRRGEDTTGADDDPSDVVVKVREPRPRHSVTDEVTGIEGSTRLEAKKQRRREGRAAGRRRSAVLTEAEFLARREQVERRMVVRQSEDYSQLAVLEDGALVEHYVDRSSAASSIGNIYLGKVQNVLPSMEAAFVDIGRGRNAVLYAGEVDWSRYGKEGEPRRIEHALKSGDQVLVQVSKDPVGQKGARLTSHISIPGRFIVYSPGGQLSGISRKLADTERKRLKKIIDSNIPSDASVIVRTAAEGASEEDLERDINRLKAQWEVIERKAKSSHAPAMLYTEPDLTLRIIRDLFTADFTELVVAGAGGPDDAYDTIKGYIDHVAPDLGGRLTRWDTETQGDPFAQYRIDEQIAKALERKVFLPSGGSLVIDRTEAMTVIDVNTGKFTGSAGNLEATVTANNLEAAEEIVRQLRLRDIGGIIVTDFIDMVLPVNRELLVRRLVECLGRDRTRHQVSEVTSLGLVQMTRKKIGTGLAEAFTEECKECGGRGYHRFTEPVDSQAPADGGERSAHKGRSNHSRSGSKHSGHGSRKSD